MDPSALKKKIRAEVRADRLALSRDQLGEKSLQIFLNWKARFSLEEVGLLHFYKSSDKLKEVDTLSFERYAREKFPKCRLAIPVTDTVNGILRHALLSEDIVLKRNTWGIPEPHLPRQWIAADSIDMVLVPMLAFDSSGYRLGYGKGYYDRFLSRTRPDCLRIGLCFDLGMQETTLPCEPHDIPMHYVVTESKVHEFGNPGH